MPPQKQSLTAEAVLQTLRELFPTLQQQYQIQNLGLCGSVRRNEATETSDIDLLIELQPDINYGLITFCHLENILSEALGKKVDLVIKENLKPSLRENIMQEVNLSMSLRKIPHFLQDMIKAIKEFTVGSTFTDFKAGFGWSIYLSNYYT